MKTKALAVSISNLMVAGVLTPAHQIAHNFIGVYFYFFLLPPLFCEWVYIPLCFEV